MRRRRDFFEICTYKIHVHVIPDRVTLATSLCDRCRATPTEQHPPSNTHRSHILVLQQHPPLTRHHSSSSSDGGEDESADPDVSTTGAVGREDPEVLDAIIATGSASVPQIAIAQVEPSPA